MRLKKKKFLIKIIKSGDYTANKSGDVFSHKKSYSKRMAQTKKSGGYLSVRLYLRSVGMAVSVHQFVYFYFNGPYKSGLEINHIDGNKCNNSLVNLEAVTPSANSLHTFKIGLKSHAGERNANCKLTEDHVIAIRHILSRESIKHGKLALDFNVDRMTIRDVATRKTWKHL